ncbi:MFS general substrate transporter [Meredithblackwellia eburnea MCA 4105]
MSSTPDEKPGSFHHDEHYANSNSVSKDVEGSYNIDPALERRTMRKVDWRLIPILSLLYTVSLIDRTNISVARVAGMAKDLKLTVGERYSIISLAFFPTYIVFELPSNIILRKLGARNHLTIIVIAWGAIMLGMGWCKTWTQLLACRILLGVLEAGFFPACLYIITCWYTRFETQRRLAFFYTFSMCVSGFSQIIGWAMSLLSGKHHLNGWQWIFIIYGTITIGLGIIGYFLIVDFPDKATFLRPEESKVVMDRINADRGDAVPDEITASKVMKALADWHIWAFSLMFCASTTGTYAFAYFLPVILSGGGYNTKTSLLLSAPPYVVAAIFAVGSAYGSDKSHRRGLWLVINTLVCITGLCIIGWGSKLSIRYFGSFLAISGCQANIPAVVAFQANNICKNSKRAVSAAIVVGGGGVGGIIASLIFRQKDYPRYIPGIAGTIAFQGLLLILLAFLAMDFRRKNAKADRGELQIEGIAKFRYTI